MEGKMKKSIKVLLPLLLLAVLVVFGVKTARADEYVPVKTISNSGVSKPSYSDLLAVGYDHTDYGFLVYPVQATATGKMWLDIKTDSTNEYSVTAVLGTMEGTQIRYNSSYYGYVAAGTTKTGIGYLDVVKGNTYYVGLKSLDPYAQAQVRTYIYSYANNRTVKASSSVYTIASCKKGTENTTLYYKVTPTKTGVMTVTLKEYGNSTSYGYVTLMNSSKKALSEKIQYSSSNSSYKVRFGVKKGVTYYLKVEGVYGKLDNCYKYGIRYTVSAATDRALSTKAKAMTLKRGATATKTLFVGSRATSTDWYKFKVTAKRETVVKVDFSKMRGGSGSDSKATITFYRGSTKIGNSTTLYAGQYSSYTITYGTTYGKANAGTYYVKIVKSAKLNGQYSIKYVK